ncbi:purine permease 1-like [Punica granatum]|uniref:Probable purine permease n=1 Tax=Punica granatum TaxID=22663 RepID=A0A218X4T1_PUNGR|nr:purine permease 1-like [Punica granatum]OWM79997.1 hypothetical protein CDL15_Pgr006301 [Punica granatum]
MAEDEVNPNNTALCRKILLVLNCIILSIGTTGGPLVMRLYFIHGGERVWLLSWLETAAWPIIMAPLAISYTYRRRRWAAATAKGGSTWPPPRRVLMKPFLFVASAVVGVLTGVDNYLYAYGNARLPVSTSSLIIASQLAFTAGFAFLLVKQRFTSYSINSVFLLTLAAVVLALHAGSDRPEGESDRDYMLGFVMTVVAAALYGFLLPLVELSYKKGKQAITYSLVLEYQLVMCCFATAFSTVGMLINKDFQVIPREAKEFGLGEFKYYTVLVCSAIVWQCFFLGTIGVIFCASSLSSGVVVAVMLPVTEILAVIFFKEKFSAEKGVSLVLSLWGLISYFYKEIKHIKKMNLNQSRNQDQNQPPPQEVEMNGQSLP